MTVLGGVVLAAGFSRRMGRDKLGLPWPGPNAGCTVLDAVLVAASALPVGVVVVGPETGTPADAQIGPAVPALPPGWTRAHCPDRALGQAASLRAGLAALPPGLDGAMGLDGVMVLLGDMPLITPELVRRLASAFRPGRFLVPACGGVRGNPVCIPATRFAQVMALTGDTGARPLLAASPDMVDVLEVGDRAVLNDLDTPEDYSRLTNQPSCAEP